MDPDQKALIEQIIDARVTLHLARTRLQDQQAAPRGPEKLTSADIDLLSNDIRNELAQLKIVPQTSGITIAGSWPSFTVAIDPAAIVPATDPLPEETAPVEATHPWKATANGDEFINVAAGMVTGYKPLNDGGGEPAMFFPFIGIPFEYAGGAVEITSATGWLYARVETTNNDVEGLEFGDYEVRGTLYRPSEAPTVIFSDLVPAAFTPDTPDSVAVIYIPIASVTLTDGIAAVTKQALTHNPSIQLDKVEVIPII